MADQPPLNEHQAVQPAGPQGCVSTIAPPAVSCPLGRLLVMRHHLQTFSRPLVAALAALALLAAGCGQQSADPAPPAPAPAASPEAPALIEPEPAPGPGPEPAREPTREPAPPRLPEPESSAQPRPQADESTAADIGIEPAAGAATTAPDPEPSPVADGAFQAEPGAATPEPEPEPGSEPDREPEPELEPEPESAVEPELAPCPEGQHRHGDEPCHYDDPEPEPVQAEPQPETAIVEIEDEPDSDEVHPHTTDTVPDPPAASGVFPSARGEQPTVAWQVHLSGTTEGARPLPTFTPAVQAWSDWCFFDWAPRRADTQAARQGCANQLTFIGLATELLGITDLCATRQYRGQMEMLSGEGEFDFATDFGRVGWHACPSVIDLDPSDDIPSPYFDADLYELAMPADPDLRELVDDACHRASWAAAEYLRQQGIWMAEWRC